MNGVPTLRSTREGTRVSGYTEAGVHIVHLEPAKTQEHRPSWATGQGGKAHCPPLSQAEACRGTLAEMTGQAYWVLYTSLEQGKLASLQGLPSLAPISALCLHCPARPPAEEAPKLQPGRCPTAALHPTHKTLVQCGFLRHLLRCVAFGHLVFIYSFYFVFVFYLFFFVAFFGLISHLPHWMLFPTGPPRAATVPIDEGRGRRVGGQTT